MKRILWFISGIIILSLVACSIPEERKFVDKEKTVVVLEGELVGYNKNQLVNDADLIIQGIVISQEMQNDFRGFPVTDTVLEVNTVFKGKAVETVEIRVNGGENDDIIMMTDEKVAPSFKIGEEVVLFLTNNKGSRPDKEDFGYYIVGQYQGKFEINDEGVLNNEAFNFKVKSFMDEIKLIEQQNVENNLPKTYLPEGEESDI